jgi:hypothetical protein
LKGTGFVDVIFISSDQSEDDQIDYYKHHHGDWNVVPWSSRSVLKPLDSKYEVAGIPHCVLLDEMFERVDSTEKTKGQTVRGLLGAIKGITGPIWMKPCWRFTTL